MATRRRAAANERAGMNMNSVSRAAKNPDQSGFYGSAGSSRRSGQNSNGGMRFGDASARAGERPRSRRGAQVGGATDVLRGKTAGGAANRIDGAAGGAADKATGEASSSSKKSRRKWPKIAVLSVLGVLLVVAALLSWQRWLRFDDARDIQGTWQVAGANATITISADSIQITGDVSYAYELDSAEKTLALSFGVYSGSGHYWFSGDRQTLVFVDGAVGGIASFAEDFSWSWEEVVAPVQGRAPALPSGENVVVLRRASADGGLQAAQSASEQGAGGAGVDAGAAADADGASVSASGSSDANSDPSASANDGSENSSAIDAGNGSASGSEGSSSAAGTGAANTGSGSAGDANAGAGVVGAGSNAI